MIHAMIPTLEDLVWQARKHNVPIIYVQNIRNEWNVSDVSWEHNKGRAQDRKVWNCMEGSWGADFYKLTTPARGEHICVKHRYSAFIDTDLDLVLRSQDIRTLIIAGVNTNVCVESTARDGFMKDYYIVFLSDCTAAVIREDHEATLRNIQNHFGIVTTSMTVVSIWGTEY